MGSEWETKTLGELINLGDAVLQTGPFGTALKADEYTHTGVPLISVREIQSGYISVEESTPKVDSAVLQRLPKFVLKSGDIVFARKGGVERNALITSTEDGWFLGSDGIFLRLSKKYDSTFFSYVMRSPQIKTWLLKNCEGTTMPSLNQKILSRIPLSLPPLSTQRRVGDWLKKLDTKITLNRQINQTLEQMAQALFKSWFVDFDPVIDNALAAGNPIPDELQPRAEQRKALQLKASGESDSEGGYKPLPESVQALFPDTFEESELGWVPEGWGVKNLTDLVESVSQTYPLKTVDEVIFLNTGDIENGRFLHRSFSSVTGLPGQAKKSIKKGDILFSEIRPKNKRFAFVNFDADNYVVSTKLMVLRSKEDVPQIFSYFLLTMGKNTDELQRIAELRSGTFPQITYKELELINFVFPSDRDIVQLFVSSYLEPFYKQFFSTDSQNETLINLRDTLLPKLISGELQLDQLPDVVESLA